MMGAVICSIPRLLGGLLGGEVRFFLHDAFDVLDHHDGVVDDDADGEDHGEEGDGVGGVADGEKDGEGGDQADRDGDDGDNGGAEAAEEHEDDDDDEDEGFGEGLDDLLDRVADEGGAVVEDGGFQALGVAGGEAVQGVLHALAGLHGVGAGGEVDAEGDGGVAVEAAFAVLRGGAEFDAGDVLDLEGGAVGIGADDDLAELGGRGQAALGLQVDLELGLVAGGAGADAADGGLHVLLLDGEDDVAGREVEAYEAVGVEPDAHGVVERAERGRRSRRR